MMMTKRFKELPRADASGPTLTFLDHIRELQMRLFYIAVVFLIMSGIAYLSFDQLVAILTKPLGTQELVYLTPGGAFSFMIQVCMYVGLIASLPVIIYHIYKFIMPVMPGNKPRTVVYFTIWSFLLAIVGIVFAYFVSLPASLYFLTSFDLYHINPMLTIDSYFSFVMTYLFAGAVLFQVPIILLIINTIKPLRPSKLMSFQRHVILGSFVFAAIISPTPDALNQFLLASPMVVMYQAGIMLVWMRNRRHKQQAKEPSRDQAAQVIPSLPATSREQPQRTPPIVARPLPLMQRPAASTARRSMDGVIPQRAIKKAPPRVAPRQVVGQHSRRTIDGFFVAGLYKHDNLALQ